MSYDPPPCAGPGTTGRPVILRKDFAVNRSLFAAFGIVLFSAASAFAQQPVLPQPAAIAATRAAMVNGKPIPKTRLDAILKQQVAQGAQDTDQLRHAIVDNLVNFELVVQDAEKKGLTKNPDVREEVEVARQQAIFGAYMNDYFKTRPITEATLRTTYDKLKAQRGGDKEYKARHILLDNEAQAKDVIAKMDKGAKIEDFAKESKDVGSRERGGDLGWAPATNYVKPFADALSKLDKGKYTKQPVQSQFGWHVIQLDDVRSAQFPPFEQVKPQLQQLVQREEVQKLLEGLRSKAKIEN